MELLTEDTDSLEQGRRRLGRAGLEARPLTVGDLVRELDLTDLTRLPRLLAAPVKGAHASDQLSDILANAPRGGISITLQAHLNAVAVAVNARQSALLFTGGRRPSADVIERARAEGVALLATDLGTFDVVGRLYALGLRGDSSTTEETRRSA